MKEKVKQQNILFFSHNFYWHIHFVSVKFLSSTFYSIQNNVLKSGPMIDPVKALDHWSDRMTIDPVYIKIFMTKSYIMNEILIKKILSFFISI